MWSTDSTRAISETDTAGWDALESLPRSIKGSTGFQSEIEWAVLCPIRVIAGLETNRKDDGLTVQ